VNGNGGGGSTNGGADTGSVTSGVPVIGDTATVSQATNRDYAVPTFMALDSPTMQAASVGYAGSASDGLTTLDATHSLTPRYTSAPNGHIVATADVTPRGRTIDLALGFGRNPVAAAQAAHASLRNSFRSTERDYTRGWHRYDAGLRRPRLQARAYYLSANVLKASVDKTFPGAIVASLASPWGQAVSAGDLPGGKPVYFGSYREVFSRDLYEAVTGLIADGDLSTARAATRFLFDRQQQPAGNMPRNSLLNGKAAPDTGGDQLDETAYPILMAYLTGLGHDRALYRDHVVPAADYLVAHGPSEGNERWEEQSGFSPSTIAAEIAGLTAAATIAKGLGDTAHARLYQASPTSSSARSRHAR
jgi:glucoamylase